MRLKHKAVTGLILQSFNNLETNTMTGIDTFLALRAYLNIERLRHLTDHAPHERHFREIV